MACRHQGGGSGDGSLVLLGVSSLLLFSRFVVVRYENMRAYGKEDVQKLEFTAKYSWVSWMNETQNEWMNEWNTEWMNEWMKHRMNEWMKQAEWTTLTKKISGRPLNEWMKHTEWMNEWMNEWHTEWMNAWMNEWHTQNEWMNERMAYRTYIIIIKKPNVTSQSIEENTQGRKID